MAREIKRRRALRSGEAKTSRRWAKSSGEGRFLPGFESLDVADEAARSVGR